MLSQFFGETILKRLIRTGNTSVQFQAGSKFRLGGQGAILNSALNLNTGTSGFGGIDIGAIAAGNYYYVYAVISGTTVGLVASLSSLAPTGFLQSRKIGAFNTEQISTNVEQVMSFGEQPFSEVRVRNTPNYGAVNNKICRWTVVQLLKGLELVLTQDSKVGVYCAQSVNIGTSILRIFSRRRTLSPKALRSELVGTPAYLLGSVISKPVVSRRSSFIRSTIPFKASTA